MEQIPHDPIIQSMSDTGYPWWMLGEEEDDDD